MAVHALLQLSLVLGLPGCETKKNESRHTAMRLIGPKGDNIFFIASRLDTACTWSL